jgi:hypothetical protein
MSKSLALLISEAAVIEQKLIESNGELTPEIEALLSVTEVELPEKIDNYSIVLERFGALAKFYKERAKFFAEISKRCEAAEERLKGNIKDAMTELNKTELFGNEVKFCLARTKPKLIVDDEGKSPKEYKREVVTIEVDKDRLRDDLSIGPIEGAHLEESYSLRTYGKSLEKISGGKK